MTILIINIDNSPQFVGGIKRVTSLLAEQWRNVGHKVYFVCFCTCSVKCENILGAKQLFFPNKSSVFNEENSNFLIKIIRELQIDILLNPFCDDKEMVQLIGKCRENAKLKVVSALHFAPSHMEDTVKNNFFMPMKNGLSIKNWLLDFFFFVKYQLISKYIIRNKAVSTYKYICNQSDVFVLLSRGFLHYFSKQKILGVADKIRYINNPAVLSSKTPNIKEKIVLWCGRVEFGQKRLDRMIKIWEKIYRSFPEWKLVVLGAGNIDLFKQYSYAHKIPNIIFTGFCVSPEEWYKRASILCVTSNTEGWPMVIVEAASYGCVPIAYDSFFALADLIEDGKSGFVVPAFSTRDYCRKLSLLMNNKDLRERMGGEVRKKIESYDIKKISPQWISLFETLLNARNA